MSDPITINVRPSSGKTFSLEIVPDATSIRDLKDKVKDKLEGFNGVDIKLVYSGRVLKDEDNCSDYRKSFLWRKRESFLTDLYDLQE